MKLRILIGMLVVLLADSSTARGGLAPDLLVASKGTHQVLRYDGDTGDFVGIFAEGGGLTLPDDLAFGPDGNLYVGSVSNILRFDGQTGDFIDVFASSTQGRHGLVFGPNGNLFTAFGPSGQPGSMWGVLQFDGETGENLGAFVSLPGTSIFPSDLDFGPDENLYVVVDGDVRRFDGQTGDFIDTFVTAGFLDIMNFDSDDNLYGASLVLNGVLRYDGQSGELMDSFDGGLAGAGGFVLGPDGDLYVSSRVTDDVLRFDAQSTDLIDIFAQGGGLDSPRDILFVPEPSSLLFLVMGFILLRTIRRPCGSRLVRCRQGSRRQFGYGHI